MVCWGWRVPTKSTILTSSGQVKRLDHRLSELDDFPFFLIGCLPPPLPLPVLALLGNSSIISCDLAFVFDRRPRADATDAVDEVVVGKVVDPLLLRCRVMRAFG